MNQDLPRGRRIMLTWATALVTALALYLMTAKPFAAEGTRLTADFGGAGQGLTTSSPVKLRGVTVGRVDRIELAPDGGARLTLRLEEGVRVPDTALASLEPESVFGPKFIDLVPGDHETAGPFLRDGARIARTSDSLDLTSMLGDADAIVSAVDPRDMVVIMDALGQGLHGTGADLAGMLESTGTLVDVAHRQRERARSFLADLARIAEIRGVGEDLNTLVTSADPLMDALLSGQDRGLRFARGVTEMTAAVGQGLGAHENDLRQLFRSMERSSAFLDSLLSIAGDSVRTIIDLIPVYKALGWTPGPGDRHLIGAQVLLPTDPCELVLGICSQGGR
ncbi:MlaD family protein [Actinocorallia libanotica]|uniref:Phospholipid/cholesterol/gamma-HCH transport system substrate-binding protein n=1 Tax=Actinocorallia libanotica TaxID=46162 RepID=A0ABN1R0J9_9ACTN